MPAPSAAVLHHLSRLRLSAGLQTAPDAVLLERFIRLRDEASFAALVARHGPMVRRLCRRLLGDEHAAEDAFQAAFLALARNAHSIRRPESLTAWLYGVARRSALKARSSRARRRLSPAAASELADPRPDPLAELSAREVLAVLEEEVERLPEVYRLPVILCCLEGKSQEEVARQLGWTCGSVKGRLERGRKRLHERLARRGLVLSAALAAAEAARGPAGAVAAEVMKSTLRAALRAEPTAAVAALADVGAAGMAFGKLKLALLAAAVLALSGVCALAYQQRAAPLPQAEKPDAPKPPDKPAEAPRTDRFGDPLPNGAIARLGAMRFYHGSQVDRVVLSPDGKWVVSWSETANRLWDARNRMWDARGGKEVPLGDELKRAAFFAAADKLVAVKKEQGRVVLWDALADKELARLPAESGPDAVALSPDGKALVWSSHELDAGGVKSRLTFADAARGAVVCVVDLKQGRQVWAFAFSADGKVLATHYADNSVEVWDVKSSTVILSVTLKSNVLRYLALAPDGGTLAAPVYGEKQIRLWDVGAKKELAPLPVVPGRSAGAVAFSADGRFLAATYENEVGLWDLAARKEIRRLKGQESGLSAPVFSRDGKRLVAGDGCGISTWDVATGQRCHDFGHIYAVDALAFSPDGRTIASGAAYTDNIVRVWDPFAGQLKGRWRGHRDGIEAIAFSPDGNLVASGSQDGTARLWEATTGQEVGCLEGRDGMIYAMAFSPDGKTLACGGRRKVVHFWDVASRKEVRAIDNPGGWTLRLAFSPGGKVLATRGFEEGIVRLWDVASGTELRQLRELKAGCPKVAFAPDDRTLAVNGDDGLVRLFDLVTGREVRVLGEPLGPGQANRCLGVEFAPDGRSLAAGYDDGTVRVWEVASGRERARFVGHTGVPLGLAYSPDGSLLASGSTDHTALVWDVLGRHAAGRKKADLSPADADRLWADLADADARRAYPALQTLLAAGEPAVALLQARLHAVAAPDADKVALLIADLENERFAARENATKELRELGDVAEASLRKALDGKPSPEKRRRVEDLLARLDAARAPALLRAVRAVEVLEYIGSPQARQVLARLAKGAPEARLTLEAKASLERLAKRR